MDLKIAKEYTMKLKLKRQHSFRNLNIEIKVNAKKFGIYFYFLIIL